MADQDRQRALCQLQNTEESHSVPPAVQELQVSSEPPKTDEKGDREAPRQESTAAAAADTAAAPAAVSAADEPQASSSTGAPSSQGDQAAAADG